MRKNSDLKSNVHSIKKGDRLFDNWWELKWDPKILHQDASPLMQESQLQYVPTPRVTRMQDYCAYVTHACDNKQNITFVFNAPSNGQKRVELSNLETSDPPIAVTFFLCIYVSRKFQWGFTEKRTGSSSI